MCQNGLCHSRFENGRSIGLYNQDVRVRHAKDRTLKCKEWKFNMVIIEFSGLSCAGKSTLIRRLKQELEKEGVVPRVIRGGATPSRSDNLRGLLNLRLVVWLLLNPELLTKREGLRALLKIFGVAGQINRIRSDNELVLLDEGTVKTNQHHLLRRARFETLLIQGMPVPNVLVHVSCDSKERLKRLRETEREWAQKLSDEKLLGISGSSAERAARRFAAAHNVPVIEVDTTLGGDHSATLLQRLRPFYEGALSHGIDPATDSRALIR